MIKFQFLARVLLLAVFASAAAGLAGAGRATPAAQASEAQPAGSHQIFLPLVVRAPAYIQGRVTEAGANAAGIPISLRFYNGSAWSTQATVNTDAAGVYGFANMPGLAGGQKYQVVFENGAQSAARLAWWGSKEITTYAHGTDLKVADFDIGAIVLAEPPHGAQVGLPYTFRWARRPGSPSDSYALRIYDTSDFNPLFVSPYVGYNESYNLASLPAGFSQGTEYTWDIILLGPDGGTGVSRQARAVRLHQGLYGRVTQAGANASGVPLQLRWFNGVTWSTRMTTTTDAGGRYTFWPVPALAAGQKYYVRYENVTQTAGRLFLWSTRTLSSYNGSSGEAIGDFDIADVALVSPSGGSTIGVPQLFQWTARPQSPTDGYILDIYDPSDYNPRWLSPLLAYGGMYTLHGVGPTLSINTWYAWDIIVSAPDGGSGVSRLARMVRFTNTGTTFKFAAIDWPMEEEAPPRPEESIEDGE